MYVEECPKNIRCDTAGCKRVAICNINLTSYKGSICLCEDCLKKLTSAIQNFNKLLKQQNATNNRR